MLTTVPSWVHVADIDSGTDWSQEDTEVPGGSTHLWEESWDDDDENEDFSKQLKYISHTPSTATTTDRANQRGA